MGKGGRPASIGGGGGGETVAPVSRPKLHEDHAPGRPVKTCWGAFCVERKPGPADRWQLSHRDGTRVDGANELPARSIALKVLADKHPHGASGAPWTRWGREAKAAEREAQIAARERRKAVKEAALGEKLKAAKADMRKVKDSGKS